MLDDDKGEKFAWTHEKVEELRAAFREAKAANISRAPANLVESTKLAMDIKEAGMEMMFRIRNAGGHIKEFETALITGLVIALAEVLEMVGGGKQEAMEKLGALIIAGAMDVALRDDHGRAKHVMEEIDRRSELAPEFPTRKH